MKITRVYNEYVFPRLGQDIKIVAVDFKKGLFTDLNTQTVGAIQIMLKNENVWFFQLEPAEENAGE